MSKFSIEVINEAPEMVDGILSHWGRITIGSFREQFVMPLNCWRIEEYKEQWAEGLNRIKSENISCLVSLVQNIDTNPLIEMWVMYREGNAVFVQNHIFNREIIDELNIPIRLSDFNSKNCYELVSSLPRTTCFEDGEEVSEWQFRLSDLDTNCL